MCGQNKAPVSELPNVRGVRPVVSRDQKTDCQQQLQFRFTSVKLRQKVSNILLITRLRQYLTGLSCFHS